MPARKQYPTGSFEAFQAERRRKLYQVRTRIKKDGFVSFDTIFELLTISPSFTVGQLKKLIDEGTVN